MTTERKSKTPTRARRRKSAPAIEKPLSSEEIEGYREKLLDIRRDLLGDMGKMENDAFDKNSNGELSSMPVHMADIGTDNYEQEFTLGLLDSERKMLKEVDHALEKIAEGTYGVCEGTGKQIGRARLNAKPYARYSVEFRTLLEKGLVDEPNENEGQAESA